MSAKQAVKVTVNGRVYERLVEVRMTLADFIRQELDLTGTHLGCEHGVCGACTVLFNGEAVRSCLMLAVQATAPSFTPWKVLPTATSSIPCSARFKISTRCNAASAPPGFS